MRNIQNMNLADNKNFIITILSLICLVLAGVLISDQQSVEKKTDEEDKQKIISLGQVAEIIPPEQVAKSVLAYINKNILKDETKAELNGEITEEQGLYKFEIKIGSEKIFSYATKDGKLFFPQAFDLTANSISIQDEVNTESNLNLKDFAKCLGEKGMKLYGASWCGWCKKQKEIFGKAAQYLPYVECIDEKTQQMISQCQEAGIDGFPTWEFQGKKESGFKTLEELSKLSGCELK